MSNKKNSTSMSESEKLGDVLTHLTDITINNVLDEKTTDEHTKKKILNVRSLVKSLASSILGLTSINLESINNDYVNAFLDDISDAVEKFCDFLDYDGDGVVELVKRDEKGDIVEGDDIALMVKDAKDIGSFFKTQGNMATNILAIISSITLYFNNNNFTQTRDDFIAFKAACEKAHQSYERIPHINRGKLFADNVDNIIKFVITLCIISVPIVDLVNKQIAMLGNDNADVIITREIMSKAVHEAYGLDLEFIMKSVDALVDVFARSIKVSNAGKKFLDYIKSCCRCC